MEVVDTSYETTEERAIGDVLTYSLGRNGYGIEVKFITKIVGIQHLNMIPGLPGYVKGIVYFRGKLVPVMDNRIRFKKEKREYNEKTSIVVVSIKGNLVGLIVDKVSEVLNIEHVIEYINISNYLL